MTPTKKENVVDTVSRLVERTLTLEEQNRELAARLRSVKGTRRDLRAPSAGEYHVGDEGPTPELMQVVQRMLTERAMTFQELLDATGARANRIKGVIMRLQRDGVRVVNLGTEAKALWFCPSEAVMDRLVRARRTTRGGKP
jgi:glutaredoxin 2